MVAREILATVNTAKWTHIVQSGREHVVPVDDLIEHDTTVARCMCGPKIVNGPHGRHVLRHWSLDGREVRADT